MDRTAVELAVRRLAVCVGVRSVGRPTFSTSHASVEFDLDLAFGDRWLAEGHSPTGVKPVETVRFDFWEDFPARAPIPSIRPDFNTEHAHVQPGVWVLGCRPIPCLVYGNPDEFMAVSGIEGLVDQLRTWLMRAAENTLAEGPVWEPMRRDRMTDFIACDPDGLRALIRPKAGYAFVRTSFERELTEDKKFTASYHGRAQVQRVYLDGGLAALITPRPGRAVEQGLALVVWATEHAKESGVIDDTFRSDHVCNVETLEDQATRFRVDVPLRTAIRELAARAPGAVCGGGLPLPIIILVRRPRPLPDGNSKIELICYLSQVQLPDGDWASEEVRSLGCVDELRAGLLRRLSGVGAQEPWALLGAGSLGSKIATSRARSGAAPTVVADPRSFYPHNAARHALFPSENAREIGWLQHKAHALETALSTLAQTCQSFIGDHRVLTAEFRAGNLTPVRWLVNTTGSTVAREWLSSDAGSAAPRGIEVGLFDRGNLGFVAVEGEGHNPDLSELMGSLYQRALGDDGIHRHLFPTGGHMSHIPIGQGCGSATMVMSDAHLSAMAAPMTEIIAAQRSEDGVGHLHLLARDDFNLRHTVFDEPARMRIPLAGLVGWTVSIAPSVVDAITRERKAFPDVETGGALVGWDSPIAKRIYIVDVILAPADSRRSRNEFVLGTEGLLDARWALADRTDGVLRCVGTWHSHLGVSTPSGTDRKSAGTVGADEPELMTLLIAGHDGFQAISTVSCDVQAEIPRQRSA